MGILTDIRGIFWHGLPPPSAIFKMALRFSIPINVSFIDRERLPGNVSCKMEGLQKDRVFLKMLHPLPAAFFTREKCNLFLKFPQAVLREKLGIRCDLSQNGFLSRSRIVDCDCDSKGYSRHLCVSLPEQCSRREFRRHERYRILSGMISRADLWFLEGRGEPRPDNPDFSYQQGRLCPLRLVNISAGGAKVVLDKLDFLDEFATIERAQLLLRLTLALPDNESQNTWLICRCVNSSYSIKLRRLTLRLQFLMPGNPFQDAALAGDMAQLSEKQAEDDAHLGIPALKMWLAHRQENASGN